MQTGRCWSSRLATILALIFFLMGTPLYADHVVPIYTYHTHAPFMIGPDQGLSFDLAIYLEEKSEGKYRFVVSPMSRLRLNKEIAEHEVIIVPWVNPAWFRDIDEKKYSWTSASVMEDGNALVSHKDNPIVYEGPTSLDNRVLGGVSGHLYAEIDSYIAATGKIRRVNADNHRQNFIKLSKRRIDATITPRSGALYLIKKEGFEDQLFLSPKPHSRYQRKLMIPGRDPELMTWLNRVISDMASDPGWQKILKKYH